jgi:DNA-binding transcriptional ArsR family regulator
MSNMIKRADFSKKIIKILAGKTAVSVDEIAKMVAHSSPPVKGEMPKAEGVNSPLRLSATSPSQGRKNSYALTRSIKGLEEAGLIEQIHSGQGEYARLTKDGKKKAHSLKLDGDGAVINTSWDGYWRMIIIDMPEDRKAEREALRYLLKKAGFICVKNSVWISMLPFENLFTNIKKDLDLTTEMMIVVTNKIDGATEEEFLKLIQK